jgi:hypothetical protein
MKMDFNKLMARMRELDAPVNECGMPPTPSMASPTTPPVTPPSMSVNINAQGMDNIKSMMDLLSKVNPDMMPKNDTPMPTMISPGLRMAALRDKMLPPPDDMDGEEDDDVSRAHGDIDNDGDHDMDDHDLEKDNTKEASSGGFDSATTEPDPDIKDMSAAIPSGDDLHKTKKSFSGKPYRGDNPMAAGAYESTDLRAQIEAELTRQLAEIKSQ